MHAAHTHARSGKAQAEPDSNDSSPIAPGATSGKSGRPIRLPPDSIPNLMPGVDPQQTPGIDHPPAEWD